MADILLQEDGFKLVLENGDFLLLETPAQIFISSNTHIRIESENRVITIENEKRFPRVMKERRLPLVDKEFRIERVLCTS